MRERFGLTWELGVGANPEEWIPATVPGAVQLDWARAHGWPDPAWAESVEPYSWMEDAVWTYRARMPDVTGLWLVIEEVDHEFTVSINGEVTHHADGLAHRFCARAAPGAEVRVLVHPAPKSHRGPPDRAQVNQSTKPAVAYGWDFHPRLIPLGICGAAYAERRPKAWLSGVETRYFLSDDLSSVDVHGIVWSLPSPGISIRWSLFGPDGDLLAARVPTPDQGYAPASVSISDPMLWWPHDHGAQPLYRSCFELVGSSGEVVDRLEQRVGFRRVRLVMAEGQWDDPDTQGFPKGPNKPPVTLEINGRRVFAKGSNWVCPDIFPGRIPVNRWRELVEMCRSANMNLLRCWGGAQPPDEAFYDACDELGIMVWQEFPLACNRYEATSSYLQRLQLAAQRLILRASHHPSHVLWCGGNELFNEWSGMTEQDLALRALDSICFQLDPGKPFLKTAPMHGMGHGSYQFLLADGRDVLQMMQGVRCTAYTEFGVPGPSSADVLERVIPEAERWPPKPEGAWLIRHAFRSWSERSWLYFDAIEELLGPCRSLQEMVEKGQLLQAVGLQLAFEEARRQKPACAMALNWCLTEPWPTAANNSVIQWDGTPKPAFEAIREALRPAMLSLRFRGFRVKAGEPFEIEPWLLNDTAAPLWPVAAEIWVSGAPAAAWPCPGARENRHELGPSLSVLAPARPGLFALEIRAPSEPEIGSRYQLLAHT